MIIALLYPCDNRKDSINWKFREWKFIYVIHKDILVYSIFEEEKLQNLPEILTGSKPLSVIVTTAHFLQYSRLSPSPFVFCVIYGYCMTFGETDSPVLRSRASAVAITGCL